MYIVPQHCSEKFIYDISLCMQHSSAYHSSTFPALHIKRVTLLNWKVQVTMPGCTAQQSNAVLCHSASCIRVQLDGCCCCCCCCSAAVSEPRNQLITLRLPQSFTQASCHTRATSWLFVTCYLAHQHPLELSLNTRDEITPAVLHVINY